jgi:hypothetical protein
MGRMGKKVAGRQILPMPSRDTRQSDRARPAPSRGLLCEQLVHILHLNWEQSFEVYGIVKLRIDSVGGR